MIINWSVITSMIAISCISPPGGASDRASTSPNLETGCPGAGSRPQCSS